MDKIKSIAVPVTRRSAPKKPRRAGHPQFPPSGGVGGEVGERRRALPVTHASPVPVHRFAVGQRLRLVGAGRYWGRASGMCRVVALMPVESGAFSYRVRSEAESFERIVPEIDLALPEESLP